MPTLYRAFAYISQGIGGEVTVYFEANAFAKHPGEQLCAMLANLWNVPRDWVDCYNVIREHELLTTWALSDASTGDARLFEIGFGPHGAHYAERAKTLLLVRPSTAARLVAAQRLIEASQRKPQASTQSQARTEAATA